MHHVTPLLPPLAIAGKLFNALKLHHLHKTNKINNIQHTIALVTKPKLPYILNQNNSIPEQTKYNKYTFTTLLMTL
jgi:hypothetical protein